MNWEAIGAIGELIGAVVVIVSVLYLAAQIRQNTEQARIASLQAVNASNDSAFNPIYIPENSVIFSKGQASFSSLNEHESVVFHMLMARLMASIDSTSYQYRQGMVDDEIYEGTLTFYSQFVSSPGGAEWFAANKNFFSAETAAKLETATREGGT